MYSGRAAVCLEATLSLSAPPPVPPFLWSPPLPPDYRPAPPRQAGASLTGLTDLQACCLSYSPPKCFNPSSPSPTLYTRPPPHPKAQASNALVLFGATAAAQPALRLPPTAHDQGQPPLSFLLSSGAPLP